MSLLRFAVALMAICSVSACPTRVEALSESDRRAVTEAVTAGMMSYAEALGALDSARVLGHYVAGPAFRRASDGSAYYAHGEDLAFPARERPGAMHHRAVERIVLPHDRRMDGVDLDDVVRVGNAIIRIEFVFRSGTG